MRLRGYVVVMKAMAQTRGTNLEGMRINLARINHPLVQDQVYLRLRYLTINAKRHQYVRANIYPMMIQLH